MLVKGLDVVGQLLVLAAMTFVLLGMLEQNAVELPDVVLRERQLGPRLEHQLHGLGVLGDFLLVARAQGAEVEQTPAQPGFGTENGAANCRFAPYRRPSVRGPSTTSAWTARPPPAGVLRCLGRRQPPQRVKAIREQ